MQNITHANQHTPDSREEICWNNYVQSIQNGSPNAQNSALEAGYSEDHARNITLQGWFKERKAKLVRLDMLSKAEELLQSTLSHDEVDEEGKVNVGLLRAKIDVAKYLTSTLGKKYGYTSRLEMANTDERFTVNLLDLDSWRNEKKPIEINYIKPEREEKEVAIM